MDISSLVNKLKELQIEQDNILQQIQAINELDTNRGTTGIPASNRAHPQSTSTRLKTGDHVTLLTGGIKCNKGDIARITKITDKWVHFVVLRNNQESYKKSRNVRKINRQP